MVASNDVTLINDINFFYVGIALFLGGHQSHGGYSKLLKSPYGKNSKIIFYLR